MQRTVLPPPLEQATEHVFRQDKTEVKLVMFSLKSATRQKRDWSFSEKSQICRLYELGKLQVVQDSSIYCLILVMTYLEVFPCAVAAQAFLVRNCVSPNRWDCIGSDSGG